MTVSSLNPAHLPLSLYIHLPWCLKKCPYCDFNSHTLRAAVLPEKAYIDALLCDLKQDLPLIHDRPLTSIFIGGGTPSLFSGEALHGLLTAIRLLIPFAPQIEITLEANPGALEYDRFEAYLEAGINRLSIGVQSFSSVHLKRLGRIHSAEQAQIALIEARQAGFHNINLDLMFALPEQTETEALADLQQAIALNPTHLSWYQLTLEPNTVFYKHPPRLPDDDLSCSIQTAGQALLVQHGYAQYEVSAYAQSGYACHHNLNYWRFGDYLGIGAGAHGKLTLSDGQIIRTAKTRQPQDYLKRENSFLSEKKPVSIASLPFEYMLNRLRLKTPVYFADFEAATGLNRSSLSSGLLVAHQKGLVLTTADDMTVTPLGERFLDDVIEGFLEKI